MPLPVTSTRQHGAGFGVAVGRVDIHALMGHESIATTPMDIAV